MIEIKRRSLPSVQTMRWPTGQRQVAAIEADLSDPNLAELIGEEHRQTLVDDVELLDGAGYEFDLEAVRHGRLSPVFFGSALTNFGVEPFLRISCI